MKKVMLLIAMLCAAMLGSAQAQITIDGDMLDWANIQPADRDSAAEGLGDLEAFNKVDFDLKDFYITSDSENVYIRIAIDPAGTFSAQFDTVKYPFGPSAFDIYFDVNISDTTGLGWAGFWVSAADYKIFLPPAYDPAGPTDSLDVLVYTGVYNPDDDIPFWIPTGQFAIVAINDDDNEMELSIPRAAINAGSDIRPYMYSVGNEDWANEEYLPNGSIVDNAPSWMINYSFNRGVEIVPIKGEEVSSDIFIDGDMLDWAGIQPADRDSAAEGLGDLEAFNKVDFDLQDLYITSDSENVYVRIAIDPAGTFSAQFDTVKYPFGPSAFDLYLDVGFADTIGLGWAGFWVSAADYKIFLPPAYDPSGPTDSLDVLVYTGPYNPDDDIPFWIPTGQFAIVAINDDDNEMEISIPRAAINAGSDIRPYVYSVGNEDWANEEYLPNGAIVDNAPSWMINYSFVNGVSVVPIQDTDFLTGIEIVDDGAGGIPKNFTLEQNYPNPFNPETAIKYTIPAAGKVSLKIYNLLGQLVKTLVDDRQIAATYLAKWDGTADNGSKVASGVYIYQLKSKNISLSKKMLLIK